MIVDGLRSREEVRVPRVVFVGGPIRRRRTLAFDTVARQATLSTGCGLTYVAADRALGMLATLAIGRSPAAERWR